jgi:winged helix DNA-binding protein
MLSIASPLAVARAIMRPDLRMAHVARTVSRAREVAAALTWPQVHAFRLERHHLARRAPRRALTVVARAIGGAQAQVMSAAELQLAVRAGCTAADVRAALWKKRTLVKTWLMRGTLHLIPAADLPLYTAALRLVTWQPSWFKYFGITERDLAKLIETIGSALSDVPMTREELFRIAGKGQSAQVRQSFRSGWGGLLKPAARRGVLCFGPSRGTSVTFVRPAAWLGSWREMDPDAALVELARRYLRAYGPATMGDFARWFAPSWRRLAAAAWSAFGDELATVTIDGVRADALAADLRILTKIRASPSVALLPLFDPYLMGHSSRDHLFDRIHRWKVSRVAGWISAVVLVDGRVEGTWTHAIADRTVHVIVEPFGSLSASVKKEIERRADTIAEALGASGAEVAVQGIGRQRRVTAS